ncbi:lipopolysaccharide transport periplasmic protein LptA [Maritimibacter sp. 55A14]|uniref:LptA/OstA family protein n=1 Tax=Maritimibacter sp. 55A14 TaxID=2174844 RepID=UPI000D61714A|nr:LptA/OstA family protein [Maritimibacter sp. 55A14]PWE33591.1 lipopolysaccharide transport periplasmic protein LptA [Maritimibacter sp. 55A14]
MSVIRTILAAFALTAGATIAGAQGMEVPFGTLSHDMKLPVEVSADQLDVDQEDGDALFSGHVRVGQGDMRLAAERLRVIYAKDPETGRTRISQMHATGGVVVTNLDEAAESDEAVYSIDAGTIVMTGNVLLTQGPNAISGQRFTVDLATGKGTMQGPVRTILRPESDG